MTNTLILHRILKAPRARVYECWTTPEHMPHWFMPKPHFLTDITIDLRPGGAFNSTMHVDGNVFPSQGCVLDAVKDTKFVFTGVDCGPGTLFTGAPFGGVAADEKYRYGIYT